MSKRAPKRSSSKSPRRAGKQAPARPTPAKAAEDATTATLDEAKRAELQAALAGLDLDFWESEDAREGGEELRERYAEDTWSMGTLWSPTLWAACAEAAASLELFALCPERAAGDVAGITVRPALYVDTARPDTLYFAPNPEMPAALFVPVRADAESVRAVLAEYAGTRPPSVTLRAWMGFGSGLRIPNVYSGELVEVDQHELDRFFVFSPVASTLSRRTFFSGSRFAWEVHADDLYIWDLAYPPCASSEPVLTRFKALTGYDELPLDMPVDLVSAIHGFEFSTASALEARLSRESDPGVVGSILAVIAAIGWRELATPVQLRRHLDATIERQGEVCSAALTYRWERLAWEIALAVTDEELRARIAEALEKLELAAPRRLGPCTRGVLRALPRGTEVAALHELAAARGWSAWTLPEEEGEEAEEWRAGYVLPGSTDAAPRRIAWIDVPSLELATLAIEGADAAELDAAFPGATPAAWAPLLASPDAATRWHGAAALAWLDDPAHAEPLRAFLRARLASEDWMERIVTARLIGLARVEAMRTPVADARERERHPAVRAVFDAVLAALEP